MPWSHHHALCSDTILPEIHTTVLSPWCHPLWGHPPWQHPLCCLYDAVIHQDDFTPQCHHGACTMMPSLWHYPPMMPSIITSFTIMVMQSTKIPLPWWLYQGVIYHDAFTIPDNMLPLPWHLHHDITHQDMFNIMLSTMVTFPDVTYHDAFTKITSLREYIYCEAIHYDAVQRATNHHISIFILASSWCHLPWKNLSGCLPPPCHPLWCRQAAFTRAEQITAPCPWTFRTVNSANIFALKLVRSSIMPSQIEKWANNMPYIISKQKSTSYVTVNTSNIFLGLFNRIHTILHTNASGKWHSSNTL